MRISDWSSDVCSSDLRRDLGGRGEREFDRIVAVGEADEEQGFAAGFGIGGEVGARLLAEVGFGGGERRGPIFVELQSERALAGSRGFGGAHAIGRKQPGERVEERKGGR